MAKRPLASRALLEELLIRQQRLIDFHVKQLNLPGKTN